jgi:hypothetical protein
MWILLVMPPILLGVPITFHAIVWNPGDGRCQSFSFGSILTNAVVPGIYPTTILQKHLYMQPFNVNVASH